MNQSFVDLEVWKKAREIKLEIYGLLKTFPSEEKFRLTDQIIRALRSISSNIAEGHGRFTFKDRIHFFIQARGSLSEIRNHLIEALDCNYISQIEISNLSGKIETLSRLLNGYINFLRSKI
jgi:four helix bundle protein